MKEGSPFSVLRNFDVYNCTNSQYSLEQFVVMTSCCIYTQVVLLPLHIVLSIGEYISYACGLVCEYLPPSLSTALKKELK